jgi:hypothetical protein
MFSEAASPISDVTLAWADLQKIFVIDLELNWCERAGLTKNLETFTGTTIKASNFPHHGNFACFLAKPVASWEGFGKKKKIN